MTSWDGVDPKHVYSIISFSTQFAYCAFKTKFLEDLHSSSFQRLVNNPMVIHQNPHFCFQVYPLEFNRLVLTMIFRETLQLSKQHQDLLTDVFNRFFSLFSCLKSKIQIAFCIPNHLNKTYLNQTRSWSFLEEKHSIFILCLLFFLFYCSFVVQSFVN